MNEKSSTSAAPRPGQVTMACWFIMIGAALLVVECFDQLGNLRSVEIRDTVTEALQRDQWAGTALTVNQVLGAWRIGIFVAAAAAVTAGILGGYALRRDRSARIGLTVAAVPIFLTAPFTGGFISVMVAASVAMLWGQIPRDWFAGRPLTTPEKKEKSADRLERRDDDAPDQSRTTHSPTHPQAHRRDSSDEATPPSTLPAPHDGAQGPIRPWVPMPGDRAAQPGQQQTPPNSQGYADPQPPGASGYAVPAQPGYAHPVEMKRETPSPVRVACVLAWLLSGLAALVFIALGAVLAFNSGVLLDELNKNAIWQDLGYTRSAMLTALWISVVMMILWALAACLLAAFAWRGHAWAWVLLLVSAGASGLLSLTAFPVGILYALGIGVSFGLLLSQPARAFFSQR